MPRYRVEQEERRVWFLELAAESEDEAGDKAGLVPLPDQPDESHWDIVEITLIEDDEQHASE